MISRAATPPEMPARRAQADPADRSLVLILGMHRSGTSCLAGALDLCGLHLGDVRRTGRHNAKGYFERPDVVQINDRILGLSGGAWNDPPAVARVHPHLSQQIAVLAKDMTADRPGGLKDPRLLLVLDAWTTAAAVPMRFVGTFRHPMAVAASLHARNGVRLEQGLALWLEYNSRLMDWHQAHAFA